MNADDLLRKKLSALAVPPLDPEARDHALEEAVRELRTTRSTEQATRRSPPFFWLRPRRRLFAAAVVIALLVALGVPFALHRTTDKPSDGRAAERTLLSQMEGLFGSQLDAVVEVPGCPPDIRLAVDPAEGSRSSSAQPVLIVFRQAGSGGAMRVLSYSGRVVCVTLGGKQMCFEPLVTGRGEVIVSGPTYCWTPGQPEAGLAGYQVSARPLSRS